MISVERITKTFGKKNNRFLALDDISFEVPSGASVAIVGKSGSGKSTLMHAMSGLDRPETGEVRIDGDNILNLKSRALDSFRSRKIGFIFQSFFVQANESVYDNVSLPLEIAGVPKRKRRQLVERALERVELLDKIKSKARNLSGGQKQRLAIARAIVNSPSILFADEPTGNLDSVTSEKIEHLLFNYNKKSAVTLILVTHDEDLASKCDIMINISDGKIVSIQDSRRQASREVDRRSRQPARPVAPKKGQPANVAQRAARVSTKSGQAKPAATVKPKPKSKPGRVVMR